MNTIGTLFRLTTFGESHGPAIGGVVDGMPSGITIDIEHVQQELNRRRPGQSLLTTSRKERDKVRFLSGLLGNQTTGAPIAFLVENTDQRPDDYEELEQLLRPSHADYTYLYKYGLRDHRGGGRSSARITISRVVAGALAKQLLSHYDIDICAYTSQVGPICLGQTYDFQKLEGVASMPLCCPDKEKAIVMQNLLEQVRADGDSIGGVVTCVVRGCSPGLGEPEFDKLQASLAYAMMSINAAKGFDYGCGFAGAEGRGSQLNDAFITEEPPISPLEGVIQTETNHSGGIQGGISNGQDIIFRVAFKPLPSISKPQSTVTTDGHRAIISIKGRHDTCALPRVVPVVEAMAAIVIADHLLLAKH